MGAPQGPIYGQNRQRTASNRLLEPHRKQSSNGLQQSCLYWETSLSIPSPCAFLNLNFTSNLQAFHLRQEGCNSDFTASLNDFFLAFQGLIHVAVLLEGPASFLSSSCLTKNHGATLGTLVWDQRTGPRTSLSSSTKHGYSQGDYVERQ